jgi:hypothetical protein
MLLARQSDKARVNERNGDISPVNPSALQALSFTNPLLIFTVLEVKLSCEMKCAEFHIIFP